MATELDKFKRRVIRSVARMMRQGQDKEADDKMWADLQKEVGCDCKLLWERMRILTLKKMKRLLPAEDRLRVIADAAQMQLTDWLLFDLILVHEDINVITEDPNSKSMKDLLQLVQMFEIEGKSGDALTTAWTAATFYYNSFGRQCSPMLLQRRWYQLKKETRSRFYNFWFEYRGNSRLLQAAKKTMPNSLLTTVAQRYPYVVTKPFKEWNELIEEKFVILPEEFEAKMRSKGKPQKSDRNEPDLVLVEPQIETIDLGKDSDSEENNAGNSKDSNKKTNVEVKVEEKVTIKEEAIDIEEEDLGLNTEMDVTEETEVDAETPPESVMKMISAQNDVDKEVDAIDNDETSNQTNDDTAAVDSDENSVRDSDDIVPTVNHAEIHGKTDIVKDVEIIADDLMINDKDADIKPVVLNPVTEEISEAVDMSDDIEEIIDSDDEKNTTDKDVLPQITNVFGNVNIATEVLESSPPVATTSNTTPTAAVPESEPMDVEDNIDDVIMRKAIEFTKEKEINLKQTKCSIEDEIMDKAMEFIKDKKIIPKQEERFSKDFEQVEDVDVNETPPGGENIKVRQIVKSEDVETVSIDVEHKVTSVKLEDVNIMNSYGDVAAGLTFVDDGIELVDDGIEFLDDDDVLPIRTDQIKTEQETPHIKEEISEGSPQFDPKLLMTPIVYLAKLDNMPILKNMDIESVKEKSIIDAILLESKPTLPVKNPSADDESSQPDDIPQSPASESDDEDYVPEEKRVKLSNYLLQKPRSRSYNPIQLCKNPDFNTRLKRLTFGFLSSTRNRSFLKTLKPMTIDVSKAFETKLINGTMYLKPGDGPTIKCEQKFEEPKEHATSVLPSAMVVQSLIDNTNVNIGDILTTAQNASLHNPRDPVITERQKTINLPDIHNIRRINQQLLTAEVTPMRVGPLSKTLKPPVQLIAAQITQPVNVDTKQVDSKIGILPTTAETPVVTDQPVVTSNPVITSKPVVTSNPVITSKPVATSRPLGIPEAAFKEILENNKVIEPEKSSTSIENPPPVSDKNSVQEIASSSSIVTGKTKVPDKPNESVLPGYRVKPQRQKVPWNKPHTNIDTTRDTLLTIDTLQKMINVVSNNGVPNVNPSKKKKKQMDKSRTELEKRMEEYERQLKQLDELEENVSEKGTETISRDTADVGTTTTVKPQVTDNYGKFCCWAAMKLKFPRIAQNKKHRCPRICECCCRAELASKTKWSNRKAAKSAEIVISDDEDGKKISDTIENVVQQSKSKPYRHYRKRRENRIEMSTQCDLGPDLLMTLENESATNSITGVLENKAPSPKKPSTRIVSHTPLPVRAREVITLDDDSNSSQGFVPLQVNPPPKCPKIVTRTLEFVPPPKRPPPLKPQGHIIIDGTRNNVTVHNSLTTSTTSSYFKGRNRCGIKEKTIYVNNKRKGKEKVASPIFLGKNKILLTDVRFPSDLSSDGVPPGPLPPLTPPRPIAPLPPLIQPQPQNQPPTVVLPQGVQLILLPNGTVTYSIAPGVEISDEEKATIPTIIEAVQEQLQTSGAVPMTNTSVQPEQVEQVDLTDSNSPEQHVTETTDVVTTVENSEENRLAPNQINAQESADAIIASVETTDSENNEMNQGTSNNVEVSSNATVQNEVCEVEIPVGENATVDNEEGVLQQKTVDVDDASLAPPGPSAEALDVNKDIIATDQEKEPAGEDGVRSEPAANTNRKSLLSDLMEMSGIWDDIDNTVPETSDNTNLEIQPAVVPAESIPQTSEVVQPETEIPTSVQSLVPINASPTSTLDGALPELTPVTSFAQLKYACENNGKFFKLDLELGTLSCGIKVCIKKQLPKSVIDLTEDDDENEISEAHITQEEPQDSNQNEQVKYSVPKNQRSLLKAQLDMKAALLPVSVKPLKLFRSVRILKRNKEHCVLLPAGMSLGANDNVKSYKRQRKQAIENVRDGNLELRTLEEFNENSLGSHSSSDDSSDDEPLASKARRMRVDETNDDVTKNQEQALVQNVDGDKVTGPMQEEEGQNLQQELPGEPENDLPQEDGDDLASDLVQELPENLMAFMPPDENDDNEDDCILGV